MSEKVYEFKTVMDFLQLTEEQFKRFLPDFIHWFILRKKLQTEQATINDGLGGVLKITPEPVIKWIDDGKVGEVNYIVTIKQSGEPVLAINEIGNIQVVSFYSDEGWDSCNEITHWQPLPPPPNSEITSIIIDEFESVEKCTA